MKTPISFAVGLVAAGTLAALRALPHLARKKQEKVDYDAELRTWEGEGGSMGSIKPFKSVV